MMLPFAGTRKWAEPAAVFVLVELRLIHNRLGQVDIASVDEGFPNAEPEQFENDVGVKQE
jgi:hypothetical protein